MSSMVVPKAATCMRLSLGEEALRDAALIEHLDRARVQAAGARAGEVVVGAPLDDGDVDLANASSAASISPVGPPPAITTACSVIRISLLLVR